MSETWNKLREEASVIASKERILSKILTEYVLERESLKMHSVGVYPPGSPKGRFRQMTLRNYFSRALQIQGKSCNRLKQIYMR